MYYAVAKGKTPGIYSTWDECKNETTGYKGAIFKKFKTEEEANEFIKENTVIVSETEKETSHEEEEFIPDYYVYTDGACAHNGKPNAKAGIGIYFGKDDIRNVSEPIEGKQTNNCAELLAVIKTYDLIENDILKNKNEIIYENIEKELEIFINKNIINLLIRLNDISFLLRSQFRLFLGSS